MAAIDRSTELEAANPSAPPTVVSAQRVIITSIRRAARNALYAAAARTALGFAKVLIRRRFDQFIKRLADELITLNPVKWAAVIGALSLFRAVRAAIHLALAALHDVLPGSVVSTVASVTAGAIVAQGARVTEQSTRTELALYMFVRAVHSVVSSYALPLMPKPVREFEHFDVITMGATGAQILYAIVFSPLSHSASYMDFLQRCTLLGADECGSIAAFHRDHTTPLLVREAARRNVGLPASHPTRCMSDMCSLMHLRSDDGCTYNFLRWAVKHITTFSLPLYAPLKLSSFFLFGGHRAVMKSPVSALAKLASSILASSGFLTMYCGGPLVSLCVTSNVPGLRGGWKIGLMAGLTCTAATFIEPKPRRLDLALYCCMHALRSWWLTMYHRGWVPKPTSGLLAVLWTASVAALFHQYDVDPAALNKKLKQGIGFIVGPAVGDAAPEKRTPSTRRSRSHSPPPTPQEQPSASTVGNRASF